VEWVLWVTDEKRRRGRGQTSQVKRVYLFEAGSGKSKAKKLPINLTRSGYDDEGGRGTDRLTSISFDRTLASL
jgi:hypothetical protein